jgi:hypothetical protein
MHAQEFMAVISRSYTLTKLSLSVSGGGVRSVAETRVGGG